MNYKIKSEDASQKLATLIECVKNGADSEERGIETWKHKQGKHGDLLIHTADQWADKGYIKCTILDNDRNDTIVVAFKYWSDCDEEIKSPYDEGIILGRFTELLLNHFQNLITKIEVSL